MWIITAILTISSVNSKPGSYRDSSCFIVLPACCKPELDKPKVNISGVSVSKAS